MSEWRRKLVAACLVELRLSTKKKLQTQDYRPTGRYPIVDQGQSLIAGLTDDDSGIINEDLPLIVFGDHTRTFKLVDFPFVRGADGTQILKPETDIDPRFFYYALQSIDLPSQGCNRHFKALKEKEIPIPQASEQSAIAHVLKLVDDGLIAQDEQMRILQQCKRAAMQALFTRGLRGEPQKGTEIGPMPESWELFQIADLGKIITGNTPPTKDPTNYVGGVIPFIAPGDIEHGSAIQATEKHITESGLEKTRRISQGVICFVCIGSTIGKVGCVTAPVCATNQQINSIKPRDDFNSQYVFYLMTFWADYIRRQASPSPVPILSKGSFEQIEIYSSINQDEQKEIATILTSIDHKIDLHRRERAVLNDLFKALLHKLMTGEIRMDNFDLSELLVSEAISSTTETRIAGVHE